MAMRFRKKPVIIEAFQIATDHWSDPTAWPEWFFEATQLTPGLPGHVYMTTDEATGIAAVAIETLEGTHRGTVGDWIIRGVAGELYPCRNDIFLATYEPAD